MPPEDFLLCKTIVCIFQDFLSAAAILTGDYTSYRRDIRGLGITFQHHDSKRN